MRRLALALLFAATSAHATPLEITFLSVGEGDATLIVSPTGKTVLVDAGPPEAGRMLAHRLERYAPLDLVVLTHRHLDHLGGLAQVIEHVGVRLLLDSDVDHPSPAYDQLVRVLTERHVAMRAAEVDRRIDLGGGAVLRILGPPRPRLAGTRSDVNANSIVARLDYRDFSLLIMGDAEAPTERDLLARGVPLAARVLKVAHHGSRYSSTMPFLRAVHPELAVISAGAHNRYGEPHPQTVARLLRAGAHVYRTDVDGDVHLSTNGHKVEVTTMTASRAP